jgi:hypothetical protein
MAADIRAQPNPVHVSAWSISQQAPTTVSWDTGDPAVEGTVWITDDAGTRKFVDRTGKPAVGATGSAPALIGLGQQVLFALKRTDDPTLNLDTVLVVGREELGLPAGAISDLRNRLPLAQGITNLRIFPAIESVRITFRTRQPTVPVIDIKDAVTHALAGSAFPFLQGPQQSHDYAFPLPQSTDFAFHILAAPAPGSASAKSAESTGLFRTGFRNAQVFFDHVFVHTDGDPGSLGDGDFTFDMGAGDVDGGGMIGAVQLVAEISGGDDTSIDQSVLVPGAPVGLWVQVRAVEDDSSFSTPYGALPFVNFASPGSTWEHVESDNGEAEIATVTQWFDLSGAGPVAQEIPFTLETGPRHIDFSLTGRVRMEARPGVVVTPQATRSFRPSARAKTVATLQIGDRVALAGERTHLVQLVADGSLRHAYADDRAHSGAARWRALAADLRGPLTVVAEGDALHLFARGDHGDIRHRTVTPGAATAADRHAEWHSLGAAATWPPAAAVTPLGVDLFALDAGGQVLHRSLAAGAPRDWQGIGTGITGTLNAFTTPRGEVGLVAVGRDRNAMFRSWPTPAGPATWRTLGPVPDGALSVECIGDVVVLAVVSDSGTVHAAPWRTYPEPAPLEWRVLGTVEDMQNARYSLARNAGVAAKRS